MLRLTEQRLERLMDELVPDVERIGGLPVDTKGILISVASRDELKRRPKGFTWQERQARPYLCLAGYSPELRVITFYAENWGDATDERHAKPILGHEVHHDGQRRANPCAALWMRPRPVERTDGRVTPATTSFATRCLIEGHARIVENALRDDCGGRLAPVPTTAMLVRAYLGAMFPQLSGRMLRPYRLGARWIDDVRREQGMEGVRALYGLPPERLVENLFCCTHDYIRHGE